MTALERKKRSKRSSVLIQVIWQWCRKDTIISNCRILAVSTKIILLIEGFSVEIEKFIYVVAFIH